MPAPHIPTPLEQLGRRPFSFYPAIENILHNEWQFCRAAGDEIQVVNTKSQQELWIPRRFLSGVSSIEEPFIIVGLLKDLEYREGIVAPLVQRVIEMPLAVNGVPRPWMSAPQPGQLAPVVGIRVEGGSEARKSRKLMGAVAAGILTCIVGMVIFRDATTAGSRARLFGGPARLALPFTSADDYESVVGRIGYPESTRSRSSPDGNDFYLLRYPDRGFTVVLRGPGRSAASYIGALGRGGRIVHSVILPNGQNSAALLSR